MVTESDRPRNLRELARLAGEKLEPGIADYLDGGADDMRTVAANEARFADVAIRARRLVDVSKVDTSVELFGERWTTPVALAPVGLQAVFDPQGELAVARAAQARGARMIASTVSSCSIEELCEQAAGSWFQLYPTADRGLTQELVERAEAAGCPVLVLTADVPVLGNRERGIDALTALLAQGRLRLGNFSTLEGAMKIEDPSIDWSIVEWLRDHCSMKLVIKGIVTHEDARLAVEHGVDGLIVSNHGGRQEESDRSTIESLPEVVAAVDGRLTVLFDGGIRRGTDVFKALALGARAVCVGRPYVWGLAAAGETGVGWALQILDEELIRIMRLAGTPSIASIGADSVIFRR